MKRIGTSNGKTSAPLRITACALGVVLALLACGCGDGQTSQSESQQPKRNPDEVLMHVRYGDEDIQITRKDVDGYLLQDPTLVADSPNAIEVSLEGTDLSVDDVEEQAAREMAGEKLVLLDAKAKFGLEAGEDEIDAMIQDARNIYESNEVPEAATFEEYVKDIYGCTMDEYRENLRYTVLSNKLEESGQLGDIGSAPDDFALGVINDNCGWLDGTPIISCIVLDMDDSRAPSIQEQAKADFDAAKDEHSTSTDYDGAEGATSELVDVYVSAAVLEMKPGEVSDVITGEEHLFIVKLIDVASVPEDGYGSMADVPDWIKQMYRDEIQHLYGAKLVDDYIGKLLEQYSV